jgi:hypothetical protein
MRRNNGCVGCMFAVVSTQDLAPTRILWYVESCGAGCAKFLSSNQSAKRRLSSTQKIFLSHLDTHNLHAATLLINCI